MRYHEPFTVFPRKLPSGLTVWYYRTRDENGQRTSSWTTGQTSKTAARDYCRRLQAEGKLIPSKEEAPKPLLFSDLARGFWDWDTSEYIKARLQFSDPKKPAMSRRYADDMKRIVELHLKSFLRRRIDSITPQEIESFALRLRDGGLSGKRVNNIVTCLRVMLGEARRAGLISWDPKQKNIIRALGSATKERGRLTRDEVTRLFAPENIEGPWKGHTLYRAVNFVAAATGARQGEILAVRDEDIQDCFLHITHSYSIKYGMGPTKTKQERWAPLPPRVCEAVQPFIGSGGFVFSMTKGESPCTGNRVTEALYEALEAIGVKNREERNVTFHSWRHWLNSTLRAQAVPDDIVRKVTGHATEEMTENYTSYLREDFAPVTKVLGEVFA